MWIYNAQVLDWKKQLNKDVKNLLNYDKMFDNFPYYKTFMQNPPKLIELKPEQTNLISQLSSWIITSNESMIKNFLK